MKISAFLLASVLASASAFAPATTSSNPSTSTQLNVLTDSDIFDMNAGRNMLGYRRDLGGMGYRSGGSDYYRQSEGSYTSNTRPGETKIEGNSRRTFDTTYTDSTQIELETDGRPLNAKVEVWEGPSNTPAKMKLWSEDGRVRPWGPVGFSNFQNNMRGGSVGSSLTVDNEGSSEFPIYARVEPDARGYQSSRRNVQRIDGNGAQRSFNLPSGPCIIEIWSEGFPYFANVQVWDGPNNIKQSAEVYADNGMDRPWSAVIENPNSNGGDSQRSGGTVQIRNPGPLEYPLLVSVEPLGGGYGYGGYDDYGYY